MKWHLLACFPIPGCISVLKFFYSSRSLLPSLAASGDLIFLSPKFAELHSGALFSSPHCSFLNWVKSESITCAVIFSSCGHERHMLPRVLYTWSTCPRSSEPEHQSLALLAPNKLLFYVWLCCWELCFLSSHHLNRRAFLNMTATKDGLSPCKVNFYFSAGSHWPRWAWKCCCLVNGWASFACWYPRWNCCSAWLSICFNFLLAAGVRRPEWV